MVVLSIGGMPPADIGALLYYSPVTVHRWLSRHDGEGVPGLSDRPRSGRPRIGSARIGERIVALLATPKAWTTTRIWQALGRPKMSLRTCYRRISEQARWARPRLIAKGATDQDTICATIRAQVTALPAGSVVLAEDETHLDLLARVRACWMVHGTRHHIPTPGSNIRRTIFGAFNMLTGAVHHHIAAKSVSVVFCYFLDQLLTAYPNAPVVVICDNGSVHTSAITRTWLDDHPRLLLLPGARYSPQDNPTERVWAVMKAFIANTAPAIRCRWSAGDPSSRPRARSSPSCRAPRVCRSRRIGRWQSTCKAAQSTRCNSRSRRSGRNRPSGRIHSR